MRRYLSARTQRGLPEEPVINLTPLIDVVFVILIMFIVVAPLLERDQVQLAHGPALPDRASIQESSPLAIYVRADNSIWFENRNWTPAELTQRLRAARPYYPQTTPQLFQDHRALFGTYQAVKNAVEMAGFERLDLVLNPG